MPPSLTLVYPLHNERENIPLLHRETARVVRELASEGLISRHEVIIVDDGSDDGSSDMLTGLAAIDPTIRIISCEQNLGYGHAVRAGLMAATTDLIFFTDSDNQFHLDDLRLLLPLLQRHDFVIGYRSPRADPPHRRLYAELYRWMVYARLGTLFRDVNCAFKVFHRRTLEGIQLNCNGPMINAELMARLVARGARFAEVPVRHRPRRHGRQSGGRIRVMLKMLREIGSREID